MSRVYQALKRAERQRTADVANFIAAVKLSPARRLPSQGEPASAERPLPQHAIPPLDRIDRPKNPLVGYPSSDAHAGTEFSTSLYSLEEKSGPLLVVGREGHEAAAEQFHLLSLNLQQWANDNDNSLFTITSALSQDGKSFVSLNLAASIASSGGHHVILVDADLRRPVLHHSFNTPRRPGLIDYLNGEADLGTCLHATHLPGLLLMPAGGTSTAPAELLAGARMRNFIRETRSLMPRHYTIVDSPAATLVPEAQILSRLAEAVLLVVAANRTPRELVKQLLQIVRGTTLFGLVLNRFEPSYSTAANYLGRYSPPHPALASSLL